MGRPEPFRALLEEARAAESRPVTGPSGGVSAPPAAKPSLAKRLDQVQLAATSTPARGVRVPVAPRAAPMAAPAADLVAALDRADEATRRVDAGFAIDAAMRDTLAAADATLEIPAQRRVRAVTTPTDEAPAVSRRSMPAPVEVAPRVPPAVPAPIVLQPAPVELAELPRPPPLPRKPKPVLAAAPVPAAKPPPPPAPVRATAAPVATVAPAPVLSSADRATAAPAPRVLQVLGDEATIPGLSPASRSSSSGKVRVVHQSDMYRLHLEFEDTPARPLPRVAHVPPPPLPPSTKKRAKSVSGEGAAAAGESRAADRSAGPALPVSHFDGNVATTTPRLTAPERVTPEAADDEPLFGDEHELTIPGPGALAALEGIEDLDAMARALGLDGVGEVSIPSLDGIPVIDATDRVGPVRLSDVPELDGEETVADDDILSTEPRDPTPGGARAREVSAVRRALVAEALDNGKETVFPDVRSAHGEARPALIAGNAVSPVIVKIPSRPKVSVAARQRARQMYLRAVEELGKGNRPSAIEHLRVAVECDDGIPLYEDLLSQLEGRRRRTARSAEGPALTVLGPNGERSSARSHWR